MAALYERLGGPLGIWTLVDDALAAHRDNPTLNWRWRAHPGGSVLVETTKARLRRTLGALTGGPERAAAASLRETYGELAATDLEFAAVVDDLLATVARYGLDAGTRAELERRLVAGAGGFESNCNRN